MNQPFTDDPRARDLGECLARLERRYGHFRWDAAFSDLVVILAQVQLALRHPSNAGASAERAREILDAWIDSLASEEPGVAAPLRMGFDPQYDVPPDEPSDSVGEFIKNLQSQLSPAALVEFGEVEQIILRRHLERVGMDRYPAVVGDPSGERACGDMVCDVCGQEFFAHPPDWRLLGYGNVPFLNVLCDGRRVKL